MSALGESIKARRTERGISLEALALKAKIDKASLSRFENGKANFLTFPAMCRVLGRLFSSDEIISIILDTSQRTS